MRTVKSRKTKECIKKRKKTGRVRGKILTVCGTVMVIGLLCGCGESENEERTPVTELVHTDTEGGETPDADDMAAEQRTTEDLPAGESGAEAQSLEKVTGNVKSIGDQDIVIRRSFEESSNGTDMDILVAPAEGSADEELLTVLVLETTRYEVHTVKNGGVNGDADVETREGSLADLKEKAAVNIWGNFEGENFLAQQVIIFYFV
ncbi:MAG: hypothetical protein HFI48_05590 [Lachnospiraceae bacterium]|nr:hypothetical protein [Lachnospiraceae bacterium]